MALVLDGLLGFRLPADGSLKLYEASGNGENFIALKAPTSVAADKTFVLPGTDGTSGQYLKTDGSGNLSFASLPTFPSGTIVGTNDTQTLTGKTINLASNTLTTTLAQLNTAVSDADVVSIAGTETLTNKTLESPNITSGLTLNGSAGTVGQVLTSAGSGLPTWSTPASGTKTWTAFTSTETYTVPAGVTSIRVYAIGGGGNGGAGGGATGNIGFGGGGGGCAYGDISVTAGTTVSISISSGVATVSYGGTTLLTANKGTDAGVGPGTGGSAANHASVTNGGAYTGGAGGAGFYGSGGGSAGSPLGNGYAGGSGSSQGGGGGAGIGGRGGAGSTVGAGGGGAGGAGSQGSGGAGGASNSGAGGVDRSVSLLFTDPLLKDCTAPGVPAVTSLYQNSTYYIFISSGIHAGPGAGGGTAYSNGYASVGGNGGIGGGGGGVYNNSYAGGIATGGRGGLLGGGGGAYLNATSGAAVGGNGGNGGGGGGAYTVSSSFTSTGGSGGAAIVLIYA